MRIDRMIAALEGELDGIAVSRELAERILDYVDGNTIPASTHSARECTAAFEWLRKESTKHGAPEQAGVALDEWHALTKAVTPNA